MMIAGKSTQSTLKCSWLRLPKAELPQLDKGGLPPINRDPLTTKKGLFGFSLFGFLELFSSFRADDFFFFSLTILATFSPCNLRKKDRRAGNLLPIHPPQINVSSIDRPWT